jgi:methyl-accepting chemotaxis protein
MRPTAKWRNIVVQKMKLGTKIVLGFSGLIAIALILGGLAVWQMLGVGKVSSRLANEYVPEVKVANELERNSLLTMYANRGYSLSHNEEYRVTAEQRLEEVYQALNQGKALADKYPGLVKLRQEIGEAETQVKKYDELARQTEDLIQKMAVNSDHMDDAAGNFMAAVQAFQDAQEKATAKDINAGLEPAKLMERARKLRLVNDILYYGEEIRVGNFKAQARSDPALMDEVMPYFDQIQKIA